MITVNKFAQELRTRLIYQIVLLRWTNFYQFWKQTIKNRYPAIGSSSSFSYSLLLFWTVIPFIILHSQSCLVHIYVFSREGLKLVNPKYNRCIQGIEQNGDSNRFPLVPNLPNISKNSLAMQIVGKITHFLFHFKTEKTY